MAKKKWREPPADGDGLPYEQDGPPPLRDCGPVEPSFPDRLPDVLEPSYVPLVRPKAGCTVRGIAVCQYAELADMHYILGEGSVPHVLPASRCPYCADGWRIRIYGYWGCVIYPAMTLAVFELTSEVLRSNRFVADRTSALRGRGIALTRTGRGKRCRVVLALGERGATPEDVLRTLHIPFDVRAALRRIWGFGRSPAQPILDSDDIP